MSKFQVLEKNFKEYPLELKDIIFYHDRNARLSNKEDRQDLDDYKMAETDSRYSIVGVKVFPHICMYDNIVEFVDDMLLVCESMDIVGIYEGLWMSMRHMDSSGDIKVLDLEDIPSSLPGKSFIISIKFTYEGKIYPVSCYYSRGISRGPGIWPSESAWAKWIASELVKFSESSATVEVIESRLRKEFIQSCRVKTGKVLVEFEVNNEI